MILQVEKINAFYGESHILFDISLYMEKGKTLCLLGRNGAGKSTTIKAIMGIVPTKSGKITYQEEEITKWKPFEIARLGIGYVPEERRVFPLLTVFENLVVAGKNAKEERAWTVEKVFALFPKLKTLANRKGGTLSGGEQQMLTIARTLMGNPSLLLLDEPSEGLAPVIVKVVGEMIGRIKSDGVTVLLTEQNAHFAMSLSDMAYVIDDGRNCFSGTIEELKKNDEIQNKYLAV